MRVRRLPHAPGGRAGVDEEEEENAEVVRGEVERASEILSPNAQDGLWRGHTAGGAFRAFDE
jgi:hypothetical protein